MTSVRLPHSARRLIVACITCAACIWMTAVGLTDEVWDLGAGDGNLFRVIRNGTRSGMRGFERTLSATEMWHVVNYPRTLTVAP